MDPMGFINLTCPKKHHMISPFPSFPQIQPAPLLGQNYVVKCGFGVTTSTMSRCRHRFFLNLQTRWFFLTQVMETSLPPCVKPVGGDALDRTQRLGEEESPGNSSSPKLKLMKLPKKNNNTYEMSLTSNNKGTSKTKTKKRPQNRRRDEDVVEWRDTFHSLEKPRLGAWSKVREDAGEEGASRSCGNFQSSRFLLDVFLRRFLCYILRLSKELKNWVP